jgi:hypothetical protein
VWIGRDTDGEVTCLVADMLILRHQELFSSKEAGPDTQSEKPRQQQPE